MILAVAIVAGCSGALRAVPPVAPGNAMVPGNALTTDESAASKVTHVKI
ncbi:MAG: hypothetical protein JO092_06435, partial [Candidatus Eremiobacteraeota bacterium]|nr:hypothetical protein [Candidatus Eremiobacteraeota bacterium]